MYWGLDQLSTGVELIVIENRQSLHYLGEISGEVSTDDLLNSILVGFVLGSDETT